MQERDTSFPLPLRELRYLEFDYANGEGIDFEPYSAFLTPDQTSNWFRAWTGNKGVDGSEFRIFGQDGSGGYAAFWIIDPSADLLSQPIVFLGSEGATGVVAVNFHDYLWLLANGIGPFEAVEYPGMIREPNPLFLKFAQEHSSIGTMELEEVIERAKNASPPFCQRIHSLCR